MDKHTPSDNQKRRGMLNANSQANRDNWVWDDFSEATRFLAHHYALNADLDTGLESLFSDSTSKSVSEMVDKASDGTSLRAMQSGADRQSLFDSLTSDGTRILDRLCKQLVLFAVTEMKTGQCCKPGIAYGFEDIAYPVALKIIRQRWRGEDPDPLPSGSLSGGER